MGQNAAILSELKRARSKGRTVRELREKTGAERVGARIKELRESGYPIQTVMEQGVTRYGNRVRFGPR